MKARFAIFVLIFAWTAPLSAADSREQATIQSFIEKAKQVVKSILLMGDEADEESVDAKDAREEEERSEEVELDSEEAPQEDNLNKEAKLKLESEEERRVFLSSNQEAQDASSTNPSSAEVADESSPVTKIGPSTSKEAETFMSFEKPSASDSAASESANSALAQSSPSASNTTAITSSQGPANSAPSTQAHAPGVASAQNPKLSNKSQSNTKISSSASNASTSAQTPSNQTAKAQSQSSAPPLGRGSAPNYNIFNFSSPSHSNSGNSVFNASSPSSVSPSPQGFRSSGSNFSTNLASATRGSPPSLDSVRFSGGSGAEPLPGPYPECANATDWVSCMKQMSGSEDAVRAFSYLQSLPTTLSPSEQNASKPLTQAELYGMFINEQLAKAKTEEERKKILQWAVLPSVLDPETQVEAKSEEDKNEALGVLAIADEITVEQVKEYRKELWEDPDTPPQKLYYKDEALKEEIAKKLYASSMVAAGTALGDYNMLALGTYAALQSEETESLQLAIEDKQEEPVRIEVKAEPAGKEASKSKSIYINSTKASLEEATDMVSAFTRDQMGATCSAASAMFCRFVEERGLVSDSKFSSDHSGSSHAGDGYLAGMATPVSADFVDGQEDDSAGAAISIRRQPESLRPGGH